MCFLVAVLQIPTAENIPARIFIKQTQNISTATKTFYTCKIYLGGQNFSTHAQHIHKLTFVRMFRYMHAFFSHVHKMGCTIKYDHLLLET